MNAKHTPGPWRATEYQPNQRTNRTQSIIWGQQVSPLATVENGPREANAHLIAAAPEMLEALQAIESCLAPEDSDLAARKVRAAIAKAIGLVDTSTPSAVAFEVGQSGGDGKLVAQPKHVG